jgi:hypothetical protein
MTVGFEIPAFLTEERIQTSGVQAPEVIAAEVLEAGLARSAEDVFLVETEVYARAAGPDGESTSIFLRCGSVEPPGGVGRCHHVKDPVTGNWVHIPGCWGGLYDPEGCTCGLEGSALDQAVEAREYAEERAERLRELMAGRREEMERLRRVNQSLRARIRELEAVRAGGL